MYCVISKRINTQRDVTFGEQVGHPTSHTTVSLSTMASTITVPSNEFRFHLGPSRERHGKQSCRLEACFVIRLEHSNNLHPSSPIGIRVRHTAAEERKQRELQEISAHPQSLGRRQAESFRFTQAAYPHPLVLDRPRSAGYRSMVDSGLGQQRRYFRIFRQEYIDLHVLPQRQY